MDHTAGHYVICESYPQYVNHIRQARFDELKPSGGLKEQTLCGFRFGQGWDKPEVKLTLKYSMHMKTENGIRYCARCVEMYQEHSR